MKTAILVTARLKSKRLPMKVIKPIKNTPMIVHLLSRLKLSKRAEQIIVCTSQIAQDDPLEAIAIKENVQCFRGDPDDVLARITAAADKYDVDTVISCTADNPFVDPWQIDNLVEFHTKNNHDYSNTEGLPWGTFSYALSRPAMHKACEIKDTINTEVWGGYFTQTGLFRWGTMTVRDGDISWPELRLTVDTPEDFQLVSKIFDELFEPGKIFSLGQIVSLCRARPDLVSLNKNVMQQEPMPILLKALIK